jgi:tRNA pseudouridine55 synthase
MRTKGADYSPVDGILLVNKPYGLTSNAVLQQVKRLFQAKKAGHTGSLDPMATGMLPICFGEATKFCQYLLDADKCYEVTGLLGIKTTTGDAMGDVTARTSAFIPISEDALQGVLPRFLGQIKQTPSMFSALKHQGMPLYQLARAGIEIPREARSILIHRLQLDFFDGRLMSFTVNCSKGTYIRNLIEDMGEQLGAGAHVIRLHRLYTMGFANEPMHTMCDLQLMSREERTAILLPMDRAVMHLPALTLLSEEAEALHQGKTIDRLDVSMTTGCIRLYEQGFGFIGIGELEATGLLKVKRLLASARSHLSFLKHPF